MTAPTEKTYAEILADRRLENLLYWAANMAGREMARTDGDKEVGR